MTSSSEPVEISSNELVHIFRTQDRFSSAGCVVLDCRPFLDFSLAHIYESRNVNWNSMLRRRSKGSVVALEWLIPDKSLLGRLRRAEFTPLVVVDERSRSLADLKPESVVKMLLTALQNEAQTQICFLQGNPTWNVFLRNNIVKMNLMIVGFWIVIKGLYAPVVRNTRCRRLCHVHRIVSHILKRTLVNACTPVNTLWPHLGGFEGFSEAFPELCYSSAHNWVSTGEAEPTGTGRRTPAYDQVTCNSVSHQKTNNWGA